MIKVKSSSKPFKNVNEYTGKDMFIFSYFIQTGELDLRMIFQWELGHKNVSG